MTTFRNPAQWLLDLFNAKGKVTVNARTAIQVPAFWYGINKISGNIGTLPINLMRRLEPQGSEKVTNHFVSRLLRKRPNTYQTPFVFKQTETARAILWGNSRSYIHRAGNASELIPLRPDATITGMVDGEKWHCTMPEKDERVILFDDFLQQMKENPNKTVMIPDRDCLHIQGFGDGVNGLSLFQVARNTLEVSLGADQRAARQMGSGFTGKVMLEVPSDSPEFRDSKKAAEFLADFKKSHGADGSGEAVGLLLGGIKANVMQMSNRDAEFISQQEHSRVDAALWLMLEGILGDDKSVSYNSEEQKQIAYIKNCLSMWTARWEQECSFKLLSSSEFYGDYFCKFNTASLLRPDASATMEILSKGIAARIYSPNDAREMLDRNPYKGGDSYENPAITPGNGGSETPATETETATEETSTGGTSKEKVQFARALSAAETVQKVYLGVGKVITSDEARKIVNDATDAGLAVPGPEFTQQQPTNMANAAMVAHLEHFMQIEQKQVNKRRDRGETIEQLDAWYDGWSVTLGDAIEKLGGDRSIAQSHCVNNLKYLSQNPVAFDLTGSAELLAREIEDV